MPSEQYVSKKEHSTKRQSNATTSTTTTKNTSASRKQHSRRDLPTTDKKSFKFEKYEKETELSKEVWRLKRLKFTSNVSLEHSENLPAVQ